MAATGPRDSPVCTSAIRVFSSVSLMGRPWGAHVRKEQGGGGGEELVLTGCIDRVY